MRQDTYISLQKDNIELAIELGEKALETSKSIQEIIDAQNEEKKDNERFFLDTMMYYDTNTIFEHMESLPVQFKDFKNQLIEIKIANDKMLLEGGFIANVDSEIAKLFLDHTLCKMSAADPRIIPAIEDALGVLDKIKNSLE